MPTLVNDGLLSASFAGVGMTAESEAVVQMPALSMTKTASPLIWLGDLLTYTVEVKNVETTGIADTIVFTDTINPLLATLVAGSVKIDGNAAAEGTDYTFVAATGLLTVYLPNMDAGEEHTITFQVKKVL